MMSARGGEEDPKTKPIHKANNNGFDSHCTHNKKGPSATAMRKDTVVRVQRFNFYCVNPADDRIPIFQLLLGLFIDFALFCKINFTSVCKENGK